jgi:DNA-binding XRE family transcriptional regulator
MNVPTIYETKQRTGVPVTETLYCEPAAPTPVEEGDPGWLFWHTSSATTATRVKVKPARYGERVDFDADMFGSGKPVGSTVLSVLEFVGTKCEYTGEAEGEFAFTGSGSIHALGKPIRNVRLSGLAQPSQETSFLRHFDGHAVINDRYAWSDLPNVYRVRGALETAARRRARHHPPSRAYRAFKELRDWLEMNDKELAKIIEVSRTTVSMSWRNGVEPHNKAKARRLFELRSVVSALHRMLGSDLSGWLKRGRPCPLKLLEQKKYERFERCADAVIFPSPDDPRRRLDTARESRGDDPPPAAEPKLLRPAGRARSKRLAR